MTFLVIVTGISKEASLTEAWSVPVPGVSPVILQPKPSESFSTVKIPSSEEENSKLTSPTFMPDGIILLTTTLAEEPHSTSTLLTSSSKSETTASYSVTVRWQTAAFFPSARTVMSVLPSPRPVRVPLRLTRAMLRSALSKVILAGESSGVTRTSSREVSLTLMEWLISEAKSAPEPSARISTFTEAPPGVSLEGSALGPSDGFFEQPAIIARAEIAIKNKRFIWLTR